MYINPFLAGVLSTIGVELIALIAYALAITSHKEDKDETTKETEKRV